MDFDFWIQYVFYLYNHLLWAPVFVIVVALSAIALYKALSGRKWWWIAITALTFLAILLEQVVGFRFIYYNALILPFWLWPTWLLLAIANLFYAKRYKPSRVIWGYVFVIIAVIIGGIAEYYWYVTVNALSHVTMEFDHYDVVPKNVADDIIASRK